MEKINDNLLRLPKLTDTQTTMIQLRRLGITVNDIVLALLTNDEDKLQAIKEKMNVSR
jgi:hypothetical protein